MTTTTDTEWQVAAQLRADLDSMGLPDRLRRQISFAKVDPSIDPSQAGVCQSRGLGSALLIGPFRLADWSGLLVQIDYAAATALDAVAARLRAAGEGARVLWHMDLVDDGWLATPGRGFMLDELVVVGPHLSADLIADIDDATADVDGSWGRFDARLPQYEKATTNVPTRIGAGRVACWSTTWCSYLG